MSDQVNLGMTCATCRYSRDFRTVKGKVESHSYLTCWRELPHECRPWNRCRFWAKKEACDGR